MVPSTSAATVPQFAPRVNIPGEFLEEEPLYVNAKQYRRILKRRQARSKLEAEGKIPKERPVSFMHNYVAYFNYCRNNFSLLILSYFFYLN